MERKREMERDRDRAVQRNREGVSFWLRSTPPPGWTPCLASSTLQKIPTYGISPTHNLTILFFPV